MDFRPKTAVIVDSNAWIEFFRRDGDLSIKLAVKGLLDAYEARLCGPVEMEVIGGAKTSQRDQLSRWFEVVPYLRNDQKLWREAARNYAHLRAQGVTAPWNDILIATIAIREKLRVYSCDKHFDLMAKHLPFFLYRPGYNGMFEPDS